MTRAHTDDEFGNYIGADLGDESGSDVPADEDDGFGYTAGATATTSRQAYDEDMPEALEGMEVDGEPSMHTSPPGP